jgi:hypothetical protein
VREREGGRYGKRKGGRLKLLSSPFSEVKGFSLLRLLL